MTPFLSYALALIGWTPTTPSLWPTAQNGKCHNTNCIRASLTPLALERSKTAHSLVVVTLSQATPEQTSTNGHDMLAQRVSMPAVPQNVMTTAIPICEHAKRRRTRQFDGFHDRRHHQPPTVFSNSSIGNPSEGFSPSKPILSLPRKRERHDAVAPPQSASRCFVTLSPNCKRRRKVGESQEELGRRKSAATRQQKVVGFGH